MRDPANEPLPVPNSEQEYVNGVADDGSPLTIVSAQLTPPWAENEMRPPIGPHARSTGSGQALPGHLESDQKILEAERAHIARVRKSVALMEGTVDLGDLARQILAVEAQIELETKRRHLERLKNAPIDQDIPTVGATFTSPAEPDDAGGIAVSAMSGRGVPPLPVDTKLEPEAPATHCRDGNATRPPAVRKPRAPRIRHIPFSAAVILAMALRAAKDLPKLSAELRDLETRLLPAETEIKLKQEFYFDRAFCVVNDMLNSMDEAYKTLGFGNWMPFRFTDQWLMFTGILNRVLAAHGLIPSGNAAVYKKLLDDTPAISLRSADAGAPKSYGLCFRNREYKDIPHMLERIKDVRAGRGPPL